MAKKRFEKNSLIVNSDIKLTYVTQEKASEMFSIIDCQRSYLREYLPWVDTTITEEDVRKFYESCEKKLAENNGFDCIIYYKKILLEK